MLSFWPGPGVNLFAGAGVFPPVNAYFLPGPGRAGGRDFGRGRGPGHGQKEIAACTESRFFPLFATNFMYSLMYSLLKIAVSRILAKIIAKSFCP